MFNPAVSTVMDVSKAGSVVLGAPIDNTLDSAKDRIDEGAVHRAATSDRSNNCALENQVVENLYFNRRHGVGEEADQ